MRWTGQHSFCSVTSAETLTTKAWLFNEVKRHGAYVIPYHPVEVLTQDKYLP